MDVTTLKRFRQNACTDPVAIQILNLNRHKDGSSSQEASPRKPRFPPKALSAGKESFAAEIAPRHGKSQSRPPRLAGDSSKLDQPAILPQKDGKVDMA